MDKQTFYAELTERLLNIGLDHEYIDRHLAQFDVYFKGKNDGEIEAEIAKLGDLDKVAARIKRMTEKAIKEAQQEVSPNKEPEQKSPVIVNREDNEATVDPVSTTASDLVTPDDDVIIFENVDINEPQINAIEQDNISEAHGTKRGDIALADNNSTITSAPLDPEVIEQNRKKFWIMFAATLPITLAIIAGTVFCFGMMFFAVAIVVLMAICTLVFVTAAGTLVSVFGLIFGVSQMLSNVPIGLYECGVAVMIGAFSLAIGILIYNFAVRFMPIVAKWALDLVHYVIHKYREIYVNIKKEVIGL